MCNLLNGNLKPKQCVHSGLLTFSMAKVFHSLLISSLRKLTIAAILIFTLWHKFDSIICQTRVVSTYNTVSVKYLKDFSEYQESVRNFPEANLHGAMWNEIGSTYFLRYLICMLKWELCKIFKIKLNVLKRKSNILRSLLWFWTRKIKWASFFILSFWSCFTLHPSWNHAVICIVRWKPTWCDIETTPCWRSFKVIHSSKACFVDNFAKNVGIVNWIVKSDFNSSKRGLTKQLVTQTISFHSAPCKDFFAEPHPFLPQKTRA